MFQCFRPILSITFYNSLICVNFLIEKLYIQTVPGAKQHRFMLSLTFLLHLRFLDIKKDSGGQSTYRRKKLFPLSCILTTLLYLEKRRILCTVFQQEEFSRLHKANLMTSNNFRMLFLTDLIFTIYSKIYIFSNFLGTTMLLMIRL